MTPNHKINLISPHHLWLQGFSRVLLDSRQAEGVAVVSIEANCASSEGVSDAMSREATPDLVMLATESAKETIDTLCRVRNSGYNGPIVVIVSRHTVLTLEDLRKFDVGAIISFSHTVPDLENLIHATLAGYSEPLAQQYSRLCKTLNIPEMGIILNAREREILDLVSNDLADREIAERLNVSVRTINNHLRHIYAKLHVRTRLGAVLAAVSRGLICAVRE